MFNYKEILSSFKKERQIGELVIILPDPPSDIKEIHGYNLPIEEQRFIPIKIPSRSEFNSWSEEDQNNFVLQEFKKRIHGYWFMNYGNLEYMTGIHYFYCSYWQIDIGLPEWRDLDRDFFYFWDYCVNDPLCMGMCYIAKRREGKTHKFACIITEATMLKKRVASGLQSKTNSDAKRVFTKFIVQGWKRLPDFFKPAYSGEKNPQTVLKFEESGKASNSKFEYKDVLDSYIDYAPTVDTAYDGQKLYRYGLDEFGKNVELNVSELWDIVKPCLMIGSNIFGKAILVTTVEEMNRRGGKNAKIIWDNSDPDKRNVLGRTTSGLYRLFFPAYYGLEGFIDDYGYSKTDEAKDYLEKERSNLSGEQLYSLVRKYPFNIQEAFRIDKESEFDIARLYTQLEYNESLKNTLVQGNFVWEEIDSKVKWVPSSNGKWLLYKLPPNELRNNSKIVNGKMAPVNTNVYVKGCDPIDHNKTFHNKQSMAASYTFRLFDGLDEDNTNIFVCEYVARPPKSEIFYEDIIMECIFFGCQILVEHNKPGLINHFISRGYQNYLMKRPEFHAGSVSNKEYGIPMSGSITRETLIRCLQTYIYDSLGYIEHLQKYGNCPFNDLLTDLIEFDVEDWTPSDRSVAAGLTLIAANRNLIKKKTPFKQKKIVIKTYNNRGIISRRIT